MVNLEIDTYRVSREHARLGRSWQAEIDDVSWMWCPRAWTRRGARRRARRWFHSGADIRKHERRYGFNGIARAQRQAALDALD